MPRLKPCLDCGVLSTEARCPEHSKSKLKAKRARTQDDHNAARTFYRTPFWRELRDRVLRAYNHECGVCGSTELVEVHHIEPRPKSEPTPCSQDTFGNLIPLCGKHHRELEAAVRSGSATALRKIVEAVRG